MAKSTEKKTVAVIIALVVVIFIAVTIFSVSIIKVIKSESTSNTTEYTLQGDVPSSDSVTYTDNIQQSELVSISTSDSTTDVSGSSVSTTENKNVTETTKTDSKETTKTDETTEYDPIAAYEKLEKQGDPYASNDPNNKHIKLISEKYGVKPELLVVLYSEPKSGENVGTNFVLEFDGSKDSAGNYIKSPDTLKKVYHIDKEGKISITQGGFTGNVGVSYADGMLVFNMIKTMLMPKYPDYFTGV